MTTSFRTPHAVPPKRTLAQRLLTAERALMGLVLLGCGLSGLLSLVPRAPIAAAELSSALMKAGFAYPLLKGLEVLLELYMARSTPAAQTHRPPSSGSLLRGRPSEVRREQLLEPARERAHAPRYVASLALH